MDDYDLITERKRASKQKLFSLPICLRVSHAPNYNLNKKGTGT